MEGGSGTFQTYLFVLYVYSTRSLVQVYSFGMNDAVGKSDYGWSNLNLSNKSSEEVSINTTKR